MNNSQYLASLKLLPLIHNTAFSKLSTRIQDTLAVSHLIKFEELVTFDAELVAWHEGLPAILVPPGADRTMTRFKRSDSTNSSKRPRQPITPASATSNMNNPFDFSQPPESTMPNICPEYLKTARAVMHWRYQNLRIVLHRPSLLSAALRRVSYRNLSAEEKVAVGRCRIIASQAIADIDSMCEAELIAGWNAVWFMYQAVMIPLVSLFTHLSITATSGSASSGNTDDGVSPNASASSPNLAGGEEDADKWRSQIETTIAFFDRMTHWSLAAKKSKDVVARLYEASKQLSQYNANQLQQQRQQQQAQEYQQQEPSADNGYNMLQFGQDGMLDLNGQNIWSLSPGGDAAMDNFWNEMQWDSSYTTAGAEMPDCSGYGFGFDDLDWMNAMSFGPPANTNTNGGAGGVNENGSHGHGGNDQAGGGGQHENHGQSSDWYEYQGPGI